MSKLFTNNLQMVFEGIHDTYVSILTLGNIVT